MHPSLGQNGRLDFLTGGGETGALIRAHDWAATPLGRPETWPQPLKTLVGIMLGSNQPMFVAWGPERTLLYNDAYAEILARKHPAALGHDFLDVWQEIRADLVPIVEQAYGGKPVHMDDITLMMERRGYAEEAHFAFSYTPARDETGAIAGFFCPCTEITGQVMAERRLAAETERQRRLFEQAPGFITILNGPEHRFEFVNQAYRRLFGDRDFVGKTVREAFPEIGEQGFYDWLDRVYATGERFVAGHVPARLQASPSEPAREVFLDFIYEPVRDEHGRVTGIFCEGHDVTEAYRAQAALEASNARYTSVLDAMSEGFIVLDEEYRITEINAEGLRLDGRPADELIGSTHWEVAPASIGTPVEAAYRRAMTERVPVELDHHYIDPATSHDLWLALRIYPVPGGVAAFYRDVCATRRAEAALRRSEAESRQTATLLEQLIETAPDPIWTKDGEGRFALVNSAAAAVMGRPREALIGLRNRDLLPPDMAGFYDAEDARILEGEAVNVEEVIPDPDRSRGRTFLSAKVPIRSSGGAVIGVLGLARDISGRKEVEAERDRATALLRSFFEAVPGVVYVKDRGGRMLMANRGTTELIGKPPEEYLGKTDAEFLGDTAQGVAIMANDHRIMQGGELSQVEEEVRLPDGTLATWLSTKAPLRDEAGEVIGLIGTSIDISERKQFEAALRESRKKLRRLNETLEQRVAEATAERDRVWRNSRDLLAVMGFDGYLKAINPAWEATLGFDEATLLAMPFWEQVHPDDHAAVGALVERLRRGEAVARFEDRLRHADGSWRWIAWSLVPEGEVFYASGRDVTAEKAAAAELELAQEALRQSQKLESMGQLTGGVAHDFNNLLMPIIGGLDMLQRRVTDERSQRLIQGALQSAERAKTLVQRLLAFARRQPLQPTAVDLPQLIEGMADLVASTSGPRVKVVVDASEGLPPVKADPNQLEMAILNLAVNARDAMPDGGQLTIAVAEESLRSRHRSQLPPGRYVRLSVSDTGVGMDGATLARAIEPFFSTKGIGKGTGLGLSMVHGLAAQLGGALTIQSKPGVGTSVELWLPVAAATPHDPGQRADVVSLAEAGTAVLVDDEDIVRASTADMLSDLGYAVVETSSAEEALALIEGGLEPDVVITDHLMPGMTGTELAQMLKQARPRMPVLIISGYAEDEGIAPDLPRLTKPFRQGELVASLSTLTKASLDRPQD
ncbi:PAS domain-containing protein [Microvirga sp. P5_D2]